jgi:hypothetical protein
VARRSLKPPGDTVPHDIHAERAAIGAVLIDPARFADLEGLVPSHFFHQPNAKIFAAICSLADSGRAIDSVNLRTVMGDDLESCGGVAYLGSLVDDTVSVNARDYARTVRQAALDRVAMDAANEYLSAVASSNGHGRDAVEAATKALGAAISASGDLGDQILPDSAAAAAQAAASPIQWAVEPLTTARGVRVFSGMGATGKTTFAMFLSVVAAQGCGPTLGMTCSGGFSVAFLDAENSTESWWRKFYAVAAGMGADPAALVKDGRILRYGIRRHYLDDQATLRRVINAVRASAATEIVIDSLTAVHRADENSSGEMRHFFDNVVFRLRDELQAGVTILHHARKPPEGVDDVIHSMRGSSDIRNAVETHISISRSGDTIRLDLTKQREAAECKPVYLNVVYDQGAIRYEGVAAKPEGRPATSKAKASDILAAFPDDSFSDALARCLDAGLSRRTFIRAWKEINGD